MELGTYLAECSVTPVRTVLVHKSATEIYWPKKRCGKNDEEIETPCAKILMSDYFSIWLEKALYALWQTYNNWCLTSKLITNKKSVTTLSLRSKVLEQCDKRRDVWSSEVQTRLYDCIDLVAAEVIYHSKCFSGFMLNKEF